MKLKNTTIIYHYEIVEEVYVSIFFTNGVFQRAEYDFNSIYSEDEWEYLAAINEKIKELKKQI